MSKLEQWWNEVDALTDLLMSNDKYTINLVTGVTPRIRQEVGVHWPTPTLDVFNQELQIREAYLQKLRSEHNE